MSPFSIYDELSRRLLVLDGGLGTMIQRYGLEEADYRGERFADWSASLKGCNDLLVLTRPEAVAQVHEAYLQAGADIITTDTFNANAISLADYGLVDFVYEINRQAAALARGLADRYTAQQPSKPRFVAGSVGPTNRTASLSPDLYDPAARSVTFDELAKTYREQIRGLIDGGVDVILIETCFDALNAKAALYALDEVNAHREGRIPAMVSGTLTDGSGRTLSGQTLEAFYTSVRRANTLSVGLNCGLGAEQMLPFIERIAQVADCAVSVHPNAGLPDGNGGYAETPESMATAMESYLQQGLVNIVGGCCGTTPAHIEAVAAVAARYAPRPLPAPSRVTRLSGLEDLSWSGEGSFIVVGAGARSQRAAFEEKVRAGQYESALGLLSAQVGEGAQIMGLRWQAGDDIGTEEMRKLLNLAMSDPGVARVPWLIDVGREALWKTALSCIQGKSLVRSLSLAQGDRALLTEVQEVLRYGALPILRLADEQGEADSYARRIGIAGRMYGLLTGAGMPPEELIFDPILPPAATEDGQKVSASVDCIEACRWMRIHCPEARLFADVDAFTEPYADDARIRAGLSTVWLYHAVPAGVTLGWVDPAALTLVYTEMDPDLRERCEDLVLGRRSEAPSRLKAWSDIARSETGFKTDPDNETVSVQLVRTLVRARTEDPQALVETFCAAWGELRQGLEGPWNEAIKQLYAWFESGALFVPQWVRSGKVLRQISTLLSRRIDPITNPKGRVMLPSLASDVQDFGKNALLPILQAWGYEVENLGGRPLALRVVNETLRCGAMALVLQAVLEGGREEMLRIGMEARRRGLRVPLVVSGPAVDAAWVEKTLAPLYGAPVYYAAGPLDVVAILDQQLA